MTELTPEEIRVWSEVITTYYHDNDIAFSSGEMARALKLIEEQQAEIERLEMMRAFWAKIATEMGDTCDQLQAKVEEQQAEIERLKSLESFCRDATRLAMEVVWGGKPGETTTPENIYIAGIGGIEQAFGMLRAKVKEQRKLIEDQREHGKALADSSVALTAELRRQIEEQRKALEGMPCRCQPWQCEDCMSMSVEPPRCGHCGGGSIKRRERPYICLRCAALRGSPPKPDAPAQLDSERLDYLIDNMYRVVSGNKWYVEDEQGHCIAEGYSPREAIDQARAIAKEKA